MQRFVMLSCMGVDFHRIEGAQCPLPGRSKSAAALAVTLTCTVCWGSKAKPAEPAGNLDSLSTPNPAEIDTYVELYGCVLAFRRGGK